METEGFVSLKELLDDFKKKFTAETCLKCASPIKWSEKQYKQHCPRCGSVVIRESAIPEKPVECWLCCDTGLVTYHAQSDGFIYEHSAACVCQAGIDYRTIRKKDGSTFLSKRIPLITEVLMAPPLEVIARRNKRLCHYKDEKTEG